MTLPLVSWWVAARRPTSLALADAPGDLDHFERNGATAQQHDLGVAKTPRTDAQAIAAFRASVCDFYQRELQCGDRCQAYVVERSPGVYLLSVHVKDLAMLQLEFDGDELKRRQGNPNIHSVLEYSAHTGVIRSLVKGGIKYHRTLIKAFCEHLLGESVDAQHLRPAALDLSALRAGCNVPQAHEDGFVAVQVKSLTLQSQDQQLKLECTAQLASGTRHVTDLIKDMLPGSERGNWTATAAQINLYYPPAPGRSRSKVVSVEITNRGRLNLHKFDTPLQAKLEGYLVSLGILQSGQTLSTRAGTGQGGALDGRG